MVATCSEVRVQRSEFILANNKASRPSLGGHLLVERGELRLVAARPLEQLHLRKVKERW